MISQTQCSTLILALVLIGSSKAWTTTTTTTNTGRHNTASRTNSFSALSAASDNDDDDDDDFKLPHGYELTTKTKKTLVFDEASGRFFEKTSDDDALFFDIPQRNAEVARQEDLISSNFFFSNDNNNDMVPTEILFGTAASKEAFAEKMAKPGLQRDEEHDPTTMTMTTTTTTAEMTDPNDGNDLSDEKDNKSRSSPPTASADTQTISIVEECYAAWNRRDMNAAVDCFADSFEYQDSQYFGAFTNKQELSRHFSQQADLLPLDSQIVIENVAVCQQNTGNIATQWHVERKTDGSTVPFTRGCSFYTTNKDGLITSGFRTSEMLIKPSKESANLLVSSASRAMQNSNNNNNNNANNSITPKKAASTAPPQSIIEEYFEAWNNRDMESALDCFVEDCIYQTEDPVFVDTFKGKAALREHLVKNAKSLPASCRIVLDKIALDNSNGTIGTRWHLEVNGIQIPNLRGCSMYTTTKEGLLKSGFDVTEAPVKLPKASTSFLSFPARLLFGGQ